MIGPRIRERLDACGISQSELARRIGLTQGTIGGLLSGRSRSSAHLHKIARELRTTPAYLTGESDDPDDGTSSALPLPPLSLMTMQVAMPTGPALMRMFQALLRPIPAEAPRDEIARRLAETLPTGLARLQAELMRQLPAFAGTPEWPIATDVDETPERPRAQRT